jgi:hypothetical protein
MSTRRHGTLLGNRVEWDVSTDNRNRPHLSFYSVDREVPEAAAEVSFEVRGEQRHYRTDPNAVHGSLTFGNGNSDPVWGIYFDVWAPRFLARRASQ